MITGIIATLLATALWYYRPHTPITHQTVSAPTQTKATLHALMATEERGVWHAVEKVGITRHMYEEYKTQWYDHIKSTYTPLSTTPASPHVQKRVQEIYDRTLFKPSSYILRSFHGASCGAACLQYLYINEAIFNSHTPAAQEFIIKHEFAHLCFEDSVDACIIKTLSDSCFEQLCVDE